MGTVPQRAAVGHGPRGSQPTRRCLGQLFARSGAVARVPVGRGRHRRHIGRPPAALLRPGAVERPRSDPERAAVWLDQRRRQPRRGRQGVLLLPRQHPDALLHADALQVPAARVSLRRSRRRRTQRGTDRSRVRIDRHRRVRRRRLLRRRRRVREADARGSADSDHGGESRLGRRGRCTCCRTLWFRNTWSGSTASVRRSNHAAPAAAPPSKPSIPTSGRYVLALRSGRAPAVYRERNQRRRVFGTRRIVSVRQGRHQRLRRPRSRGRGERRAAARRRPHGSR